MATGIDYGGEAWNVVVGCSKKSQGCLDCWALRMAKRLQAMGRPEYQSVLDEKGNWNGQVMFLDHRLEDPLRWRKPRNVLVAFMGDLFHENLNPAYIYRVFEVMAQTPQHQYFVLTKRASNMESTLLDQEPLSNVLLGVSMENQKAANERRELLRILAEHNWQTWVSFEPALEVVDFRGWEFVKWLVCGGESGARARIMPPNAAREARDFCVRHEIPFYFKQWGEYAPLSHLPWITDKTTFKYRPIEHDGEVMVRVGKGLAGHVLDGVEWREMPNG